MSAFVNRSVRKRKRKLASTSYSIFLKHASLNDTGPCGVLSKACFAEWVSTRKKGVKHPEQSFRKALLAHLCGRDGRKPFPPNIEASIATEIRKRKQWPCFRNVSDASLRTTGTQGLRSNTFHEKRGTCKKEILAREDHPRKQRRNSSISSTHSIQEIADTIFSKKSSEEVDLLFLDSLPTECCCLSPVAKDLDESELILFKEFNFSPESSNRSDRSSSFDTAQESDTTLDLLLDDIVLSNPSDPLGKESKSNNESALPLNCVQQHFDSPNELTWESARKVKELRALLEDTVFEYLERTSAVKIEDAFCSDVRGDVNLLGKLLKLVSLLI